MDDNKHKMFTGISNVKILNNIKRLNEANDNIVVRVPLIDGVNADKKISLKLQDLLKQILKILK